jgi:hypothetical protein
MTKRRRSRKHPINILSALRIRPKFEYFTIAVQSEKKTLMQRDEEVAEGLGAPSTRRRWV